jgi:hypothetical protein
MTTWQRKLNIEGTEGRYRISVSEYRAIEYRVPKGRLNLAQDAVLG